MKNLKYKPFPVYYTPMDSALLGRIWIAARESGVVFLDFSESEAGFIVNLREHLENFKGEPQLKLDPTSLSPYLEVLNAYFEEKTPIPEEIPLELACLTDFQCDVLELVQAIPFGTICTYGELAEKHSDLNASRAVGQVLRRNPLPIIIPCHRIVKAGGNIGGYGGILGSDRKIALLKHEGVILA